MPLLERWHVAKSLQDESDRGIINCIEKFFKPLDNIQRVASFGKKQLYNFYMMDFL